MNIIKDIARIGRYSLRRPSFLDDHIYNTHEFEIVEWQPKYLHPGEKTCFTIATFNKDGEIVSCDTRLIESVECMEDFTAIEILAKLAYTIISKTDKIEFNS